MAVLKQRVSRALRRKGKRARTGQIHLWNEPAPGRYARFWQRRFYDFNVWSVKKKNEKMNYMHFNPVLGGKTARLDLEQLQFLLEWREGIMRAEPCLGM